MAGRGFSKVCDCKDGLCSYGGYAVECRLVGNTSVGSDIA